MNFQYDRLMGQRIKEIRERLGLSQEQVATKLQIYGCDITRSSLAKIEVGQRHLYSHEIKAFKTVFQVSYDDLFV